MSTAPQEVPAPLHPLRCRTCGTIMGYTAQRNAALTLWCSPECRDVPISEDNPRDEVMVELYLMGNLVSHLARAFGMTRQAATQMLERRTGKRDRKKQTIWEVPEPQPIVTKRVALTRRGRPAR